MAESSLIFLREVWSGGVINGIIMLPVGGPAGFIAGFGYGFMEGAGGAIVYKNGKGLAETLNPNL